MHIPIMRDAEEIRKELAEKRGSNVSVKDLDRAARAAGLDPTQARQLEGGYRKFTPATLVAGIHATENNPGSFVEVNFGPAGVVGKLVNAEA